MNKQKEIQYQVNFCLNKIEKAFNNGPSINWQHKDYIKLAKFIEEKSGYRISLSTVKRIWGRVGYNFNPRTSSLDILAAVLQYSSWEKFVTDNQKEIDEYIGATKEKDLITYRNYYQNQNSESFTSSRKKLLLISLPGLLIALLLMLFYMYKNYNKKDQPKNVIQSISDTVSVIPYASTIHYNIEPGDDQNFYIQRGNKKYRLKPEKNLHNTRVTTPGIKTCFLWADNKKIKSFQLYGITKEWYYLINGQNKQKYCGPVPENSGSVLSLPENVIEDYIDYDNFNNLSYINAGNFNVYGDQFTLEIKFRYKDLPKFENICRQVVVSITDTKKRFISLQFAKPPCRSNTQIMYGDTSVNGKSSDLDFMNIPTDEWNSMQLTSKNDSLRLKINGSKCFIDQYNNPLNKIFIVKIKFYGSGELDYVRLGKEQGNRTLNDDF